jgi:hypothetical protein
METHLNGKQVRYTNFMEIQVLHNGRGRQKGNCLGRTGGPMIPLSNRDP